MTDRARVASPARFGLTESRAEPMLRAAGWWHDSGPANGADAVLAALSSSPDPDLALRGLDRLRESLGTQWTALTESLRNDTGLRGRLIAVLGTSTALSDLLIATPMLWQRLRTSEFSQEDPATKLETVLQSAENEVVRSLRLAYRSLLLDIAAADLAPLIEPELPVVSFTETSQRLSDLAVAALRAALLAAGVENPADSGLAVIAMGKCGGRELNYVSDVDVIFVAERDADLPDATRTAAAMMRIAHEAFFEVDAALRPEGKSGALVRTLEGHASYYRKWARTWEFQALLKARPVAGNIELGQRYVNAMQPMVWSAAERPDFVADVRAMRQRIVEHVPVGLADRELKLGRGGLRDVEFAVQLLQLVHGRTDITLRSPTTVTALAALGSGGYVARTDATELSESYRFLRMLEHRLQLRHLLRTHTFPAEQDKTALRWLGRSMGFGVEGQASAAEMLLSEFRKHANRVRRLHEKLFYRPLLEAVAKVPSEALRLTTDEAVARLAALGYAAPDGALKHIEALTSGVSRRAAIQTTLLPVLLGTFASTPDPDGALLAYRKVSEALAETPWYLRLLRDEGAVADRLARILGVSRYVPDLLVRAPEVLRLLSDAKSLAGLNPNGVATSLVNAVGRHRGLNEAVAAARSLRRHELLRVACADVLGLLEVRTVCAALSSVWIAVLRASLEAVIRTQGLGESPAAIALIGMGRLGGNELGYGSDADVLFVCEPRNNASEAEAVRYASSVAETVRRLLGMPSQDPPLQVDADLRPEGRSGPLVRTLDSYRAYYTKWSDIWEIQALLRARFIAGDTELGTRFQEIIDPLRYPAKGLSSSSAREIRRIKARVDAERLPRNDDPTTHTKLGRGGLADIEWTVQLWQLRHAGAVSGLQTTSTIDALDALAAAGLITQEDIDAMKAAWLLATKARNAVTLVRGKPTDKLPLTGRELSAVANIFGYATDRDPGEFLDEYRRVTRRARAVVERLFYDS